MSAYLADWKQLINDANNGAHVEDDQSLRIALDKLAQVNGEITNKDFRRSFIDKKDQMLEMILHTADNRPNNKQYAVALYALGLICNKNYRQLYVVPSG